MSLLQPFVWISAYTPNDPNTLRVIPLSSDVLLSFTDESVFDLDALEGSQRLRTGRLKVRFIIFDKDFTYWETLFVLNQRWVEVEYGWLNPDGTIATSSGKYAITLTQIGPRFTHQGTEIEVIGVSDLTSTVKPGSAEFFYASRTFSILFVPESAGSPYPSPLLSNPTVQNQQEDLRIRFRLGPFGQQIPVIDDGGLASADDFNIRAGKVSNPSELLDPTKKVYTYSSIGQLVRDIASMLGLRSDVDDTAPATNEILCTNISIMNMLSRLALEAKSPTGDVDYRVWVRGDTIFFKRPTASKSNTQKKVLEFNAQGSAMNSSAAGSSRSNKVIVLSVDMKVNPSLLVASARAHTISTSVDSNNKVLKGGNVVPPWRNIKETLSKTISRRVSTKETISGPTLVYEAVYVPPEGMTAATAVNAEELFYAQKWLLWNRAVELADPLVDAAIKSEQTDSEKESLPVYSNSNFNDIRSQTRIAAFQLLQQENAERLGSTGDSTAEVDVNRSLYEDALKNPTAPIVDETMSGRLYPTAFQNEQAANLSKLVMHDISDKVIQAEVLCVGDVSLRLMEEVTLILSTPTGQHYTSGNYLILGINNTIDKQGFTSNITLVSKGAVSGSTALDKATLDNKQPKAAVSAPKSQVWTDIKQTDATVPIEDPVLEDDNGYIIDKLEHERRTGRKYR